MSDEHTLQLRDNEYPRKCRRHICGVLFRIGIYTVVELVEPVIDGLPYLQYGGSPSHEVGKVLREPLVHALADIAACLLARGETAYAVADCGKEDILTAELSLSGKERVLIDLSHRALGSHI